MNNEATNLVNEALDAVDKARDKLNTLLEHVQDNDFGESGVELVKFVEKEVASQMIKAYSSLEDLYAYAEDLELAP